MNLSKYLATMLVGTIICLLVWAYVLVFINPEQTGMLGIFLFYASFSLSMVGLFSLGGFGVRKLIIKKEVDFRHVLASFRQAVFLSLILVVILILQSQRLFTWTNVSLLVVALTALEFFIANRDNV